MRYLILLLALLLAPAAWATVASTTACDDDTDVLEVGRFRTIVCRNLCDEVIDGDTACTEYDFGGNMPDIIVLEREEIGGNCTDAGGPAFTFTTGPVTGGSPAYDIDSTAVVLNDTTERVVIDVSRAVLDRYLFTAISLDTACDDEDVRMYLIYKH